MDILGLSLIRIGLCPFCACERAPLVSLCSALVRRLQLLTPTRLTGLLGEA